MARRSDESSIDGRPVLLTSFNNSSSMSQPPTSNPWSRTASDVPRSAFEVPAHYGSGGNATHYSNVQDPRLAWDKPVGRDPRESNDPRPGWGDRSSRDTTVPARGNQLWCDTHGYCQHLTKDCRGIVYTPGAYRSLRRIYPWIALTYRSL